jgi:hypothetical protein
MTLVRRATLVLTGLSLCAVTATAQIVSLDQSFSPLTPDSEAVSVTYSRAYGYLTAAVNSGALAIHRQVTPDDPGVAIPLATEVSILTVHGMSWIPGEYGSPRIVAVATRPDSTQAIEVIELPTDPDGAETLRVESIPFASTTIDSFLFDATSDGRVVVAAVSGNALDVTSVSLFASTSSRFTLPAPRTGHTAWAPAELFRVPESSGDVGITLVSESTTAGAPGDYRVIALDTGGSTSQALGLEDIESVPFVFEPDECLWGAAVTATETQLYRLTTAWNQIVTPALPAATCIVAPTAGYDADRTVIALAGADQLAVLALSGGVYQDSVSVSSTPTSQLYGTMAGAELARLIAIDESGTAACYDLSILDLALSGPTSLTALFGSSEALILALNPADLAVLDLAAGVAFSPDGAVAQSGPITINAIAPVEPVPIVISPVADSGTAFVGESASVLILYSATDLVAVPETAAIRSVDLPFPCSVSLVDDGTVVVFVEAAE